MVLGHLLLLLGLAIAEEASPEDWAREKSTLTSRIKELEAEVAASWCDTRDTRGFVVSGLMVNCPAGQVFPGTGKDSGLVSCLPGGCPRYVPDDTCQERGEGTNSILLTGGSGNRGSKVPDFLYPASSSCTPPAFPDPRLEHVTFTTPSGLVASCGGKAKPPTGPGREESLSSCLVLEGGKWQADPRVPDLPVGRWGASVAVVPAGVFIMGGQENDDRRNSMKYTSFVLPKYSFSWEEGPELTGFGALYSCSVALGDSVFLTGGAIEGKANQLRELDSRHVDTYTWEWQEEGKWPQMGGKGRALHGCAVLNSQLIVAGGQNSDGWPLFTTDTLDLATRGARWQLGGRLKMAKYFHAMVTMGPAGKEKLYALGGGNDGMLDNVEVWDEESRTWREEQERLPKGIGYMGAVAVMEEAVCQKKKEDPEMLVIAGGDGEGGYSHCSQCPSLRHNVTVWPYHPSCNLPSLPSPSISGFGSLLLDQQQQLTFLGKQPTPMGTDGPLDGHICVALVNTTWDPDPWEGSCSQRVHRAGAMFASTSDGILVLGGVKHWDPEFEDYLQSTEIIMPAPGVKPGLRFEMKMTRRHGCLVRDGEAMVVTGGETAEGRRKFSTPSVSRFTMLGPGRAGDTKWELMEDMQQARAGHACGLVNYGGTKALVVAGGFFWEPYGVLDTTEILVLSGPGHRSAWTFMDPLPSPRFYSAGAVLGGSFILSGGHSANWPDKLNEMLELELPS